MSDHQAAALPSHRTIGPWWIVGLVVAPIIFAWPLLRNGFSPSARALGFGWLFVTLLITLALPAQRPASDSQAATPVASVQREPSEADERRREREQKKGERDRFRARAIAMIAAEDLVREQLRDPESARFTGTATYAGNGGDVVCGFVNAKNGFGGMTGKRGFIVVRSVAILEESDEKFFLDAWSANCRGAAVQTR